MDNLKIIKLVSGDTIMGPVEVLDTMFKVVRPIQLNIVKNGPYGSVLTSEWFMSEKEEFKIRKDHIVAAAPANEMMIECYQSSVEQLYNHEEMQPSNEPEPERTYSDNILDMMSYSSKCIH